MEEVYPLETLTVTYQITWCYNPEYHSRLLQRKLEKVLSRAGLRMCPSHTTSLCA